MVSLLNDLTYMRRQWHAIQEALTRFFGGSDSLEEDRGGSLAWRLCFVEADTRDEESMVEGALELVEERWPAVDLAD